MSSGDRSAAQLSRDHVLVDAETGKPFNHELLAGETYPVDAPSGKKAGYPCETCYWTVGGQVKKDPTYVLLNSTVHKPGATFCPDCGRLVIANNPKPANGSPPPPTKAQADGNL